jgi:hypothetical protein
MSTGLLHTHSLLRYFVLFLLLVVIVKSLIGWLNNKPFGKADNKLSLFLLIFTHIQFLVGLILYFVSNMVQFNSETMKNDTLRYWAVEHITGMLIAVVLITAARSTSKKMTEDIKKHKRLAIFNLLALIIIIVTIALSGRGILSMSAFNS